MPITRRRTTVVEDFDNSPLVTGPTRAPSSVSDVDLSASTGDFQPQGSRSGADSDHKGAVAQSSEKNAIAIWIAKNWIQCISGLSVVFTMLAFAAWYISKFDSGLTDAQSDIKDIRSNVDRLSVEVSRHGVRLDNVERVQQLNLQPPHRNSNDQITSEVPSSQTKGKMSK